MDVLGDSEELMQRVIGAGRKTFIPAESQHFPHRLAAAGVIAARLLKGVSKTGLDLGCSVI